MSASTNLARRLAPGGLIPDHHHVTGVGQTARVPDPGRLVHLQFRRFAGCPVCDLHLHTFSQRHAEIEAAGVREIVLFHSSAEGLRPYTANLPFAVVADPDKHLYREFGIEAHKRALLDRRVWWPILRSMARSLWLTIRHGRRLPPTSPEGGRLGLPADFLIGQDGRILACKYGEHAFDQWSVDELLTAVRAESERPTPQPA